jgi:hypothetical protein
MPQTTSISASSHHVSSINSIRHILCAKRTSDEYDESDNTLQERPLIPLLTAYLLQTRVRVFHVRPYLFKTRVHISGVAVYFRQKFIVTG